MPSLENPLPSVSSESIIRDARREDLPAVLTMIGRLAEHHDDAATTDPQRFAADVFGPEPWVSLLVAEQTGMLVGYVALIRLYRAQYGRRGVDLHHLFVEPTQRGTGLGRRLVYATLDWAASRHCRYVRVSTAPDNEAAQRFYERLGFEPIPAFGPRYGITIDSASRFYPAGQVSLSR